MRHVSTQEFTARKPLDGVRVGNAIVCQGILVKVMVTKIWLHGKEQVSRDMKTIGLSTFERQVPWMTINVLRRHEQLFHLGTCNIERFAHRRELCKQVEEVTRWRYRRKMPGHDGKCHGGDVGTIEHVQCRLARHTHPLLCGSLVNRSVQ